MVEARMVPNAIVGGGSTHRASPLICRDDKKRDVRHQNIVAARAVADAVRTSLGPRGMDKMIQNSKRQTLISNDGATLLKEMAVVHPTAKMLVELSKAQDVEAGDGTTSVVVICGALLRVAEELLDRGLHPQQVVSGFKKAATKADELLKTYATPIDITNEEHATQAARVALASKVVSDSAPLLAPIAVEACMRLSRGTQGAFLDLSRIRIVKMVGGSIDDTSLIEGVVFTNRKLSRRAMAPPPVTIPCPETSIATTVGTVEERGRPSLARIKDAKIGIIQFCLSAPKTDMDNHITINSGAQMDRLLKNEKLHIAKMVQKIAKTGCNVLIVQKSILRDALTDLSLDYLAKQRIVVVRDLDREEIDYIAQQIGCNPISSIDLFTPERLGFAKLLNEEFVDGGRILKITGLKTNFASTILLRASNEQLLDEGERSLHDALCAVRCLFKYPAILPGGGATEMFISTELTRWAQTIKGTEQLVITQFAEALTVIPYSLAESAALPALETIAQLKVLHSEGKKNYGIDARQRQIADAIKESIIQPITVSQSAIALATETVCMILKIDDTVFVR